jgi:hypothetical protein
LNRQAIRDQFFTSATEWLCDSYSLGIHYVATADQGVAKIIDVDMFLFPLPPLKISNFSIQAGNILAGQKIFPSLTKAEILERLTMAATGKLEVNGLLLTLDPLDNLDYYSELPNRNTWFTELHLLVSGSQIKMCSSAENIQNDDALRTVTPAFDGMDDLCSWLGLTDARSNGRAPSIKLRVGPPVDMIFDSSKVENNVFELALRAHPKLDISKVGLATREFPGNGTETRRQSGNKISWKRVKNGARPGILKMKLTNAASVLAILIVGGRTVRRQWFNDPEKAVNPRYVATQLFDKDLKQLRQSVTDSTDSVRFEQGIASLLYLLGFSTAIQVETQAPDILVSTPGGKLAIVECTTKISDFQNKLGKLVERRNALVKSLESTGHNLRVDAFIACGLPKSQIAVEDRQLTQHQVTLICREDISYAFAQLRIPTNPDELLDQAAVRLSNARNSLA